MDQIDARVWAEYQLWFAFTAVLWPPDNPRLIAVANYFDALGYQVAI